MWFPHIQVKNTPTEWSGLAHYSTYRRGMTGSYVTNQRMQLFRARYVDARPRARALLFVIVSHRAFCDFQNLYTLSM